MWGLLTACAALGLLNLGGAMNLRGADPSQAILQVSPLELQFEASVNGAAPDPRAITVINSGSKRMAWEASTNSSWIILGANNGSLSRGRNTLLQVFVETEGLTIGRHEGSITVEASDAENSPQVVHVTLSIVEIAPWKTLRGHEEGVTSLAFGPKGNWIASASEDETIKIWEVAKGKELHTLSSHSDTVASVAFSPDGDLLASGSWDRQIKLWDVRAGVEVRSLSNHWHYVTSVAFGPDGLMLASGSTDRSIRLWEVATGIQLHEMGDWKSGNDVSSVSFSSDGELVASGHNHGVRLWDVSTGDLIQTLLGHDGSLYPGSEGVQSVAFSPGSDILASGSRDRRIILWDIHTFPKHRTLSGHNGTVTSVAFTPDGQFLVSGSTDGSIKLWQVSTGQEIFTLNDAGPQVTSVAISPDGKYLVSGSSDGTVRVWSMMSGVLSEETMEEIRTFYLMGFSD